MDFQHLESSNCSDGHLLPSLRLTFQDAIHDYDSPKGTASVDKAMPKISHDTRSPPELCKIPECNIPAIAQLIPHILQVRIPHVLHAKDKAMLIAIERLAHISKEFERKLLALLVDFGQVDDARALGFRHVDWDGGVKGGWWWLVEGGEGSLGERCCV